MTENDKRIKKPYQHDNHKRAISRRELLGQGVISFSAVLAMPNILSLLSSKAMAQGTASCAASSQTRMIPFIVIDLAGGANIAGTNVIVGSRGGQLDFLPTGSYRSLGLTPEQEPANITVNRDLGLGFHPQSKMLAGILETTTAATRANMDGTLFCTSSGDDTRNNPHNPLYWIAKSGANGELVSLVGTNEGQSGGNAVAPAASVDPSRQPSRITSPQDALGLVDPGKLAAMLSTADVQKILGAVKTMSDARLKMFQQKDMPTQIQELVRCGYINSSEFLSRFEPDAIDPRSDQNVTAAFPNLASNNDEKKGATIAKLVLDGYAGAGVISLGGYDYHGQGRAAQDTRDQEAGRMIGRVLELAAKKQKPVMIYVYTDGGVSANGGTATNGIYAFVADSGERSAAFSLVYRPTGGRPPLRENRRQIGAYKPTGAVDAAVNKLSNSSEMLTKAIVANYLALHGREGDLAKTLGDDPFGSDLDKYLAFSKII